MPTTNVDQNEIHKFSEIAHDWWNPVGQCAPLHHINPLRLAYIQERTDLKNKHIVDVGCGGGILTESLAKAGAFTTGIDLSDTALEAARTHAKEHDLTIHYNCISAEDFADNHPGQFDIVTCMEMLEHVPDPSAILKACHKLLKPNGKLFLSTINRTLKSYAFAIVGAEWILNLLPRGTHDYSKFIKPSELSEWSRQADLSLKDFKGITYNPFSKNYKLDTDISVNYLAYGEKSS